MKAEVDFTLFPQKARIHMACRMAEYHIWNTFSSEAAASGQLKAGSLLVGKECRQMKLCLSEIFAFTAALAGHLGAVFVMCR